MKSCRLRRVRRRPRSKTRALERLSLPSSSIPTCSTFIGAPSSTDLLVTSMFPVVLSQPLHYAAQAPTTPQPRAQTGPAPSSAGKNLAVTRQEKYLLYFNGHRALGRRATADPICLEIRPRAAAAFASSSSSKYP